MKLINYSNYLLEIADEALLVGPIRKLYNKDKTKNKDSFMQQMSILYFVYDPRSNYSYITDDNARLSEVLTQEGISQPDWVKLNTQDFQDTIEVYKKLNVTSSLLLLQDTRMLIENIRKVLKSIDYDNMEEKDKVNAVKTVTTIVGMIPKLAKDLSEAEKAVAKEIEEQSKARGSNELSLFDGGINL